MSVISNGDKTISKRDSVSSNSLTKWDKAIADARASIKRLLVAIDDLEAKKAAGEPWPGDRKNVTS